MGCSSSALNKAGDSSRFPSVTSNEHFSTTEESESCFAQPKPRTLGRKSTVDGNVQRETRPPLQKLKDSAEPTANGVKPLQEQPLAKDLAPGRDAADQSGSTEKTQPGEGPEESGPPQPGSKKYAPAAEGKKKDAGAGTKAEPLKGNAEAEPLGPEAKGQPLRTAGEKDCLRAVEDTENPQTAAEMKLLGTTENTLPLQTAGELQPQGPMGKDEQALFLETISKENESPEILEGSQFVETAEEQQLQATLGKEKQPQLLETIPKENITPQVLDRSQLVEKPIMNDPLHKSPEGPGNMEQIQPEGIVGGTERPARNVKTGADVEMFRNIHTNEEDQRIEGETGEKAETEMENEKGSEEAETKEEETGEAVDFSAAT
ncbi:glutamate-rich protein 5 isoform X1 [Cebus imitator]|uniref:Glutamate rich 5 n=1 Tax=Cebus imitator TaxID=2715852 RepID=A0A2K5R1N7_CEBIM|nr:glutamate-rich protein 5 isoform X1 [Cebus imitator]XP_037586045.1 glutamate-rich protein 5 isoform X1 [Cebus imitator]